MTFFSLDHVLRTQGQVFMQRCSSLRGAVTQCTYSGWTLPLDIEKSEFGCGKGYIKLGGFQRECNVEM